MCVWHRPSGTFGERFLIVRHDTVSFRDREDAGRQLGAELVRRGLKGSSNVVLALPRGGVPVGYEVARALGCPLDVFIVRKLGLPGHEELAIGAIASGGVRYLNEGVLRYYPVEPAVLERVSQKEKLELVRRERHYRGDRSPLELREKRVIVCDDGLATGSTMRAAVRALRQLEPCEVVVAVPVAAREAFEEFRSEADQIICLATPEPFQAVGRWYVEFEQTSDEQVLELLRRASARGGAMHEA